MYNKKSTFAGLLAFMLVVGMSFPAWAAEKKPAQPARDPQAPITVEADKLYFNDKTGEVIAQGNVSIKQNQDTVLGNYIRGNTQQTQVWVEGSATLIQPGAEITGQGIVYNYSSQTGTAEQARGKVDKAYISGKNIRLEPQHYTVQSGTVTGCWDPDPHYHISADKIEIWPEDRLIAYNAKFWAGKTVIFTLPKVQTSLKKTEGQSSLFPRIGYNSDEGFTIAQHLEMPLGDKVAAFADAAYYSRLGFKPVYGLVSRNSAYTAKLYKGDMKNGDDEWVKKDYELLIKLNPRRIAKTSLTANLEASAGKWTEGNISGTRQDYSLYLANDPIRLTDKLTMDLGAGFEKVNYGYNDSANDIWRFDIRLTAKPTERLAVWTGLAYNHQSGASVYQFDKLDVTRELLGGFMYKLDNKNGVGVSLSYDLGGSRVKDLDYTWSHSLHCLEAKVTYRAERDQVSLKLSAVNW